MYRFLLAASVLVAVFTTSAFSPAGTLPTTLRPAKAAPRIQWLSIEEAYARGKKEPRKFLIDVYTDWCGWCRVMDRQTFTKPAIIDYVNKHFYAVKFNAEQQNDVRLGNKTFRNRGRTHDLAYVLLGNRVSYPTTVFMDERFSPIQPVMGYLEPRTFHQVITFFGANYHQQQPFEQFKATTYVAQFQQQLPATAP